MTIWAERRECPQHTLWTYICPGCRDRVEVRTADIDEPDPIRTAMADMHGTCEQADPGPTLTPQSRTTTSTASLITAGRAYRARRKELGIRLGVLAAAIGVNPQTVYRWERGITGMSPAHRDSYLAAIDYPKGAA